MSKTVSIIDELVKAFEYAVYDIVCDLSGSEPHPQLEHEMMTKFANNVENQLKYGDIPFMNEDDSKEAITRIKAMFKEKVES